MVEMYSSVCMYVCMYNKRGHLVSNIHCQITTQLHKHSYIISPKRQHHCQPLIKLEENFQCHSDNDKSEKKNLKKFFDDPHHKINIPNIRMYRNLMLYLESKKLAGPLVTNKLNNSTGTLPNYFHCIQVIQTQRIIQWFDKM